MAKTTTAGMDAHLALETTTLAMAALITRTDGQKFRVTTSSESITLDIGDGDGEQVYSAEEGVSRTNIESDAELNVDNLDIVGIFDNVMLQETELRRGLFDFADFQIFVFNWADTTDGIIKIFRGQFGEVIVTKQDFFQVQVRSMVQVYSKETGETYSKDCRADLGDIRCRVPLFWDSEEPANKTDRTFPASHIAPNVAYELGDFVTVPTAPSPNDCAIIQMNFEGADGATSGPGFVNQGTHTDPTLIGTPEIDTAQLPAGGDSTSSMLFDGSTDGLSFLDAGVLDFGSNEVTIHGHFRLNSTGTDQTLASKHQPTGDQRAWRLRVLSSNVLEFDVHDDGLVTPDITLTGGTTILANTDYHVAVVRKTNGDWEMFLDGVSEAGPTTPTGDVFNSTSSIHLGVGAGGAVDFLDGWLDSWEIINGFPRWETGFTAPTGNLSNVNPTLIWEDYGDRMYEVTTAGTSGPCVATPDETITNTHNQGTAVLTANHSWMRFAEVTAVDGSEPRRIFTVTELTPVTGEAVGANRLPSALGFPDDWFNGGGCYFEGGNNAGRSLEVRDFTEGAGSQIIELISDLPFDVVIGDKLRIFPGCDKTNPICISKFNSGITFVGEPYVPGEDVLGQYPDAR
jgi:hypothetical protein